MIIDEFVDVKVANNAKRYESLGYNIPKKYNKRGKLVYDTEKTIKVQVSDLSYNSSVVVNVKCDYCGKEYKLNYNNYHRQTKRDGLLCCYDCRSKKSIITVQKKYGVDNVRQLDFVKEKAKQTCLEKYGVEHQSQSEEFKKKYRQTCLDKYGVEHQSQSEEFKKKYRQTCLDKYGVENASSLPETTEKRKQTCLEKYGVEYSFMDEDVKALSRKTLLMKYGVEHPIQSEVIKNKIKLTNLTKYGYEYPSQNKNVRKKISESLFLNNSINTSTQQIYLNNLFNGEINYPIRGYNADIAIKSNNIIIEYNGGGHDLCVKTGSMSPEEFKKREIIRTRVFKEEGWKIIFFSSLDDKIPFDDMLLQLYDYGLKFFYNNPDRSWIEFDFTNGVIRNAINKDGIKYNYGELRRIYKSMI